MCKIQLEKKLNSSSECSKCLSVCLCSVLRDRVLVWKGGWRGKGVADVFKLGTACSPVYLHPFMYLNSEFPHLKLKTTFCRANETARNSLFHEQQLIHSTFSRIGATLMQESLCLCMFTIPLRCF